MLEGKLPTEKRDKEDLLRKRKRQSESAGAGEEKDLVTIINTSRAEGTQSSAGEGDI